MIGLLGRKIGMSQVFEKGGMVVPVTLIQAGPCPILQVKTKEKDGYSAIQLGFGEKKTKNTTKPVLGKFNKLKIEPKAVIRELRVNNIEEYKVGQTLNVEMFNVRDLCDVTGISIGKGFQGGVKRWHWKSGDKGHGSMSHRRPGSIGGSSNPSRVFKGHHLPGRMGGKKTTVQHLEVVKVDKENNLLVLRGSVPGHDNGILIIRKGLKKKVQVVKVAKKPEPKRTGAKTAAKK